MLSYFRSACSFPRSMMPYVGIAYVCFVCCLAIHGDAAAQDGSTKNLRVGIIGLDTSHATAFTKMLNAEKPAEGLAGCRVVAAYPKGSPDIQSSVSRVPNYIEEVKKHGVEIVESIEQLLERVDVVLLETNDGRPHLEQAAQVMRAGKRMFIDKPLAGSLADAIAIFEFSKQTQSPIFSSSSLRYSAGAQAIRRGEAGDVFGCDAYSPCSLEATHPDLFWYGIHGVETLFTVMGAGCQQVTRVTSADADVAVGVWKDGRVGTFRGMRTKPMTYGGTVFAAKGVRPVGGYDGYQPLLVEIVKFFHGGPPPISAEETLQIYAFMEAADESKRQGGSPVRIEEVMKKAQAEAARRLSELSKRPAE